MVYLAMTAGAFLSDYFTKAFVEKRYEEKEKHPVFQNRIIIEKYYNDGAAFNFLAKKPKLMRGLQTAFMVLVCISYYCLLRRHGSRLRKTGMALLTGGGLNNLYDRYTKGHVVDYFRINIGPKWLRTTIFNLSDFFIFMGAVLAAAGAEK